MANTTIQIKNSGAIGNVPSTLSPGELAINYADGKLFYGNTTSNSILFDVNNPAGLEGELQFNSTGEFGSSADLHFNNTTKTLNVKNVLASGNTVTDTLSVIRTTNLGNVSNVTITGGSPNQFLITDGSGNLSFGVGTMGAQGAAGAQGTIGAQGVQGAVGAQGVQGAAGAQGTIGAQGAIGAQGVQGAAGAQGVQGSAGAQGAIGAQGVQGAIGAQGVQGSAGAQGVQGSTGEAAPYVLVTTNTTATSGQQLIANTYGGIFTITLPATPSLGNVVRITDGYDWSINNLTIARNGSTIEGTINDILVDVRGTTVEFVYDGATWQVVSTIGPMGNTGAQGVQGAIGAQGAVGAQGVQGSAGAQGAVGAQGVQGSAGAQGAVGAQGVQGAVGAQGTVGAQGVQGAVGAQGVQGAVGAQGVQGAVGAQGAQGPQGSTPAINGSNTNIIFNNEGSLAGSNNFTWNGSKVTVTGEHRANVHVATNGIVVNSLNVASSYTIEAGYSGTSAGPITVNSGATVTVAPGSRWVIV